ncbi:hypothetical protein [Brevundimonas sp. UBA7664]|uniref:hypothetical protein n=1 Tax=Brevundimonas sp. UBA7664 TaxID=1946141 RepID=UPI0025B974AE|nr:hypothetical protein [Brevundimonas sp. UBA7664]
MIIGTRGLSRLQLHGARAPRSRSMLAGLLTGTALGCSLMVAMATPALADNECGPAGATVVCPANTYNTGIRYANLAEALALNVPVGAFVNTTANYTAGIEVQGGNFDVSIFQRGPIRTSGLDAPGIYVETNAGNVTIDADDVATTGDYSTTSNFGAEGIFVYSNTGDVSVTARNVSVDGFATSALAVVVNNADIVFDIDAITSTSTNSATVFAQTQGSGDVTITSGSIDSRNQGIAVFGAGAGTVIVTSDSISIANSDAQGHFGIIMGVNAKDVIVDSGSISTTGLAARGIGITAASVDITSDSIVTTGGPTTTRASDGIAVIALTGDVTIDSGTISTSGLAARGVGATANLGSVDITSGSITTAGNGALGIQAFGSTGVTIDSGSISTSGTTNTGGGMTRQADAIWVTGGAGANFSITSDSITTTGVDARGIVVDDDGVVGYGVSNAAAGTGALVIDSGGITTGGFGARGMAISHAGAVDIVSGTIATEGDSASGITLFASADTVINSGTITTEGQDAFGIEVRGATGDVTITSDSVTTLGDYSNGLLVFADDGAVSITSGSVSTSGDGATGISVVTNSGAVTIDSGFVSTSGDYVYDERGAGEDRFAEGISVFTDTGAISITSDVVNVSGLYASGIVGITNNADITIDSGDINSTAIQSVVLYAQAGAGGDIVVDSDSITGISQAMSLVGVDDITVRSGSAATTGARGFGLFASTTSGVIDITSGSVSTEGIRGAGITGLASEGMVTIDSDAVSTTGAGALGIRANGRDGVTVTSGTITTIGGINTNVANTNTASSDGIFARSVLGDIIIDSGTINVSGLGAAGINAFANIGNVTVNSGSVTTAGDSTTATGVTFFTNGIYAQSSGGAGNVSVTSGSIDVSGARAWGLYARSFGGAVNVDSGSIITSGLSGRGIYAVGLTDVSVISDSIVTSGEKSSANANAADGIFAANQTGDITIDSGTIQTSGQGAVGIYANAPLGAVSIISDSISTAGDQAAGIWVQAPTGTISLVSGDIETDGSAADGIRIDGGAGDVSVTAETVNVAGLGAEAITITTTTGDITLDVGTLINTGAFDAGINRNASGIRVSSQGGAIEVTADWIELASIDAMGINADTQNADIAIYSGSIFGSGTAGALIEASTTGIGQILINSDSLAGSSFGINASADDQITINSGSITIDGSAATRPNSGILALSSGGSVIIDSGEIATTAPGGFGIMVLAGGDASITSGSISTASGAGLNYEGVLYTGNGLDITAAGDITIDSGSVSTTGLGSTGIFAQSFGGGVSITSDAVTTSGDSAAGILALASGDIVIDSGTVVTSGDFDFGYDFAAEGIYAESVSGAISITSDDVTVGGYATSAIVALTSDGAITVDSGSVVSTSTNSATVFVRARDSGAISISSDSLVSNNQGVVANGQDDVIINSEAMSIGVSETPEAGHLGISAVTTSGGIVINSGTLSTAGLRALGIGATASEGTVTVDSGSVITLGDGSRGISVGGRDGVTIISDSVSTSGGLSVVNPTLTRNSTGIFAMSQLGDVTVDSGSVITAGEGAYGINALANTGSVNVTSGAIATAGLDATGLSASSLISTTVVSGTISTTGDYGKGILADSLGAVSVTSESITTAGGVADGLVARGSTVMVDSGTIRTSGIPVGEGIAQEAHALTAFSSAGNATIISDSITTLGEYSLGIIGGATDGNLSITSGSITTAGLNSAAIVAFATRGNVAIDSGYITTSGTGGDGIQANIEGQLSILSDFIILSGNSSTGINVAAAGGLSIANGSIVSTGDFSVGIRASSPEAMTITTGDISMSGEGSIGVIVQNLNDLTLNVTGDVTSTESYAAYLTGEGAATINITAGSSLDGITGLYLNTTESSTINILGEIIGRGGLAMDINGAAVTINNNSNTIIGGVRLTDEADTFNNNGTWMAFGESDFGDGDDNIVNNGLFESAGGDVSIIGLETFRNEGVIDLRDGVLGNSADIGGAAYVGGAGSTLLVDVDFSTGQSDSLVVGSASGSTEVVVNNVATTDGFSPGFSFIESDTPLTGDEFSLDASSLGSGFVALDLQYDPLTNSFVLAALPSDDSVSMLRLGAAAQDYASKSGEAWTSRMEDVRDSNWSGTGRRGRTEAWGQILLGERDLEQAGTFDLFGTVVARDLSSETEWSGAQFGVDRALNVAGDNLIVGFTGGFGDYRMAFDQSATIFHLRGFNFGGYGAWQLGGLNLSGLAKLDVFEATATLRDLGARSELDGHSVDVQVEAAYRLTFGNMFFEPVASLDYIRVDLDQLAVAGATADFETATSLRARAGARFGGKTIVGAYTLTPSVGVFAIEELEGENEMLFSLNATSYSVADIPYDTHGRADFGVGIDGPAGLQAFLKTEIDFGDGAEGVTARIGARWSW